MSGSSGSENEVNPLGMSDEDFLKATPPGTTTPTETVVEPTETTTTTTTTLENQGNQVPSEKKEGGEETTTTTTTTTTTEPKPGEKVEKTEKTEKTDVVVPGSGTEAKPGTKETTTTTTTTPEAKPGDGKVTPPAETTTTTVEAPPDYEKLYKAMMTPFQANGRQIELKSPEEAMRLMQMGANYTKKMQEIAPQRKLLQMLANNQLDESKLSFLIDIDKKNPEAIKKLLKDANIDPVQLDVDAEPKYQPNQHLVSDDEANFRSVVDDLKSSEQGRQTIAVISSDWDQASKDILWKNPSLMGVIDEQRGNGIYTRISSEIDRRRTLGQLPTETPFLQAYKLVGDEMVKANAFDDLAPTTQTQGKPSAEAPTPVATRVITPKPEVTNNGKAAAASTSRTTPVAAKVVVNPLAMSDEDFLKQMQNRV